MADSPCTCCGQGFNGRAFIAYVNFYDDRELIQKRLRLCINCISDHFLILVESADSRNERGVWIDAKEQHIWENDAQSENTVAAARAALSSVRPPENTPTSKTLAAEVTRYSAA